MCDISQDYPKDYKGPKAGLSDNQEWLEVTEFEAYKYMVFGIWKFSDFDCWLGSLKKDHFDKGTENSLKALKEFQKMYNIKAELNSWYPKK